jgi:hypothetical protein
VYIGTHTRFIQRKLFRSVHMNTQTFHTDNIIWKCTYEHTNVSYRENYLEVYIGTHKRFIQRKLFRSVHRNKQTFHTEKIIWKCT